MSNDFQQGSNNAENLDQVDQSLDDQWGEAFKEQQASEPADTDAGAQTHGAAQAVAAPQAPKQSAQPAPFGQLKPGGAQGGGNLEMILDIPVTLSVEIGRTKIVVNDLLQLGEGSVVELEKFAGEPMEVFVNNRLIARGEAVVVNEKFGVRLTDIVSPLERINKLK